jgi:hypothetical protein
MNAAVGAAFELLRRAHAMSFREAGFIENATRNELVIYGYQKYIRLIKNISVRNF